MRRTILRLQWLPKNLTFEDASRINKLITLAGNLSLSKNLLCHRCNNTARMIRSERAHFIRARRSKYLHQEAVYMTASFPSLALQLNDRLTSSGGSIHDTFDPVILRRYCAEGPHIIYTTDARTYSSYSRYCIKSHRASKHRSPISPFKTSSSILLPPSSPEVSSKVT